MADDQATPMPSPSVLSARFARLQGERESLMRRIEARKKERRGCRELERDLFAKTVKQIKCEMRELKRQQ
jgi:hypothetical protein